MTSIQRLEECINNTELNEHFIQISDIGCVEKADSLFHCVVTSTAYRVQCIHHSATVGMNFVFYTVADGSSYGVGSIFYVALLEILEIL